MRQTEVDVRTRPGDRIIQHATESLPAVWGLGAVDVRVHHYRYAEVGFVITWPDGSVQLKRIRSPNLLQNYVIRRNGLGFHPRGGRTVVRLIMPDGQMFEGISDTSMNDNFNKQIGRDAALGRALKQARHWRAT